MDFAELVATSGAVAAESGRSAKRDHLARLLEQLDAHEIEPAVGFLIGETRQGRIGVGWRTLAAAEQPPSDHPSLTITEVDATVAEVAGLHGPGSAGARQERLGQLLGRATTDEAAFLARLVGGELRQGANAGVMTDAVAKASGVPATVVRRAVMFGGRLDVVAHSALTEGRSAVEAIGLEVGRPHQPMLASTAASVTVAVEAMGSVAVEWKLDGIRIQVHRRAREVSIYTRNLNDITERLGDVVDVVRSLPGDDLVLDGEALVVDPTTGRPVAFQDTASRVSADDERPQQVQPFFFDIVHLDGTDLADEPLHVRRPLLKQATGQWSIPGTTTDDPATGEAVLASALAAGHEGVVVKALDSTYEAGRRGKAWRKVKPVHTLDLVVLAAEWGHGRRTGWLSNLHLGARQGEEFVMVGKTFKGLTDETLRWQTERLCELAVREEPWDGPQTGVVWVRPEQVVEIAIDGAQRSTRYPGGVALRFARVVRYRADKAPSDADTLAAVQSFLPPTPTA